MEANSLQASPTIGLRRLFPKAQFFADGDISVSACTADSRDIRGDDLFVAIVGANTDGLNGICDATVSGKNDRLG